jgi:hypothetical protein
MARLSSVKTLAGFDFSFQPSLDRNRILTLAQLDFIGRHEVVHLLGQPGTGKSHLALALGVEAVKAGHSVYFATLADLIASLAKAERESTLRERLRFLCRPQLLIVDEIGYLPVISGGGNLFFQLVNARYEKGAMILTSNRGFAEWGEVFSDPVVATALLDRLLPRRRGADRGCELPRAPARRPHSGEPPDQDANSGHTHASASPRQTSQGQKRRSHHRLITENRIAEIYSAQSAEDSGSPAVCVLLELLRQHGGREHEGVRSLLGRTSSASAS